MGSCNLQPDAGHVEGTLIMLTVTFSRNWACGFSELGPSPAASTPKGVILRLVSSGKQAAGSEGLGRV